MGNGRYKNGEFDLIAIANHVMTANDFTEWERCFRKVSEILYNASEGQMEFGNIFVCDDSIGLETADAILYPSGDPSYSSGTFGNSGAAVHLMPYVKTAVLTLLHELGHSIWGLGDEYSAPYIFETIDATNPAPDNKTIPIIDSGRANNELTNQNAQALLMFGGQYERKNIVADTSTSITVDSNYSDLPTEADYDWVLIQIPAECSSVANSNYCIMEKSRSAAGYFDAAGNWQTVPNPVTEFCSASNHDPDNDTAQEDSHGKSCWETIVERAEFDTLNVPDPASGVAPAGFTDPNWFVLDKQPRFALVLDRSGSMSTGNKMADAQHGTVYWLEYCAEGNDKLTIIWYDHLIERILDLTQVNTLPNLNNEINAINALTPRGSTNIRDGLYEALNQIQTPVTRAAVQVALLLTDGMHNTPYGSQATEVLSSFKESGTRIYCLGVGDANVVDMDVLDELATGTGGTSYAVGDDQPGIVEAAMVEINAEVRGGIITTNPLIFPDTKKSMLDKVVQEVGKRKRPGLEKIFDALGVKTIEQLIGNKSEANNRLWTVPVKVEKGMERVSFTIVYPEGEALWLYLIDPKGSIVDMSSSSVKHIISKAPHEFALVTKPKAGTWHMVVMRSSWGNEIACKAVAGAENRRLQVFGGADSKNCANAPVRIWAKVHYSELLSGLRVTAQVVSPTGGVQRIRLDDDKLDEPSSGEYFGYCKTDQLGRYYGHIKIENTGRVTAAMPVRRLLDSDEGKISTEVKTPTFVRVIPFYFDSGDRPKLIDVEDEKGLTSKYEYVFPRKNKLVSARKISRKSK